MNGNEMRALRKKSAMTQHEMAERLGVSRKTIVTWEGQSESLPEGTELKIRNLAGQIRVLTNVFLVEVTPQATYAVVHRRNRELPHSRAMFYSHAELTLMGVFQRRVDAYRWCGALQSTADPRGTRKLQRERAATIDASGLS